jgi:hypothetical protein
MFKFNPKIMIRTIIAAILLVLAGIIFSGHVFAEVTNTFWNKLGSGSNIYTNVAGTPSGQATIHVGGCVIEPAGTPCGSGTGVGSVTGTDPITVDNTNPAAPIVGLSLQVDSSLTGDGSTANPLSVVGSNQNQIVVNGATTGALQGSPVYLNGVGGVGATLVSLTGNLTSSFTGYTPVTGDRVLIKSQAGALRVQNGVYDVTARTATTYTLTRSTDSDTSAELHPQAVSVTTGTGVSTLWSQQTANPTVGTSFIIYASQAYPAFVTQEATGTQVSGQLPTWNAVTRQLTKGTNAFTWLNSLLTVNGSLKQDLTYLTNHYKTEASSDLFGIGAPGVGIYAGPNSIIAPSGSGAVLAAVNSSGNFLAQMSSYTANYEATATSNGVTGAFSYNAIDKTNNFDSGITADVSQVKINASNNLTKNNEFVINWSDETARLRNNANTNEAIHTTLEYNAPQKTAFNWNTAAPQTSTITHNGSFASNTTYVTADYTVDDSNPLVPDNTIAVFTDITPTAIAIQMPSAADFLDREIGIYNVGQDMNSLQDVRVSFVGTEFNGVVNQDRINAVPYEFKLYKAVRNDVGTPIWILKYTNRTLNGYKFFNYDASAVIAGTEDGITYGFGEDSTTIGSPTMDISSTSAPNIPLGTTLTVKDIGNNASVMNIIIDAGTDEIIDRNSINPTLVLNTNGGSYTLQKMYNSVNGRTYWMVIASV